MFTRLIETWCSYFARKFRRRFKPLSVIQHLEREYALLKQSYRTLSDAYETRKAQLRMLETDLHVQENVAKHLNHQIKTLEQENHRLRALVTPN